MKAIVQRAYGEPEEVLSLTDVPTPAIEPDEVLVRVKAASVHPDVWHMVTGRPYVLRLIGAGVRRPKRRIPGTDLAGIVESVGASVTGLKAGDEVFGESIKGYQWTNGGAFAEYAAVRGDNLARKPANISFEQAASVPTSGSIALSGLRDQGRLKAGQKILINGAGGGVGLLAVQIAVVRKLAQGRSARVQDALRPPDAQVGLLPRKQERYDSGPARSDRGRQGDAGRRPDIPPRRGRAGDSVPG